MTAAERYGPEINIPTMHHARSCDPFTYGPVTSGQSREKREVLVECCFTSTETVGLLGTGAQDVHLDFHTPPEL